jgi:AraC-like DNA-binding protein
VGMSTNKEETATARLMLLLVDLRQQQGDGEDKISPSKLQPILAQRASVHRVAWAEDLTLKIPEIATQVLFFEYDYPDIARLSLLQQTKLNFPSLPIILVTEQHSEALAVWAFRSRVWDYFVVPLVAEEILHCLESLEAVIAEQRRDRDRARKVILPANTLPADARFRSPPSKKNVLNAGLSYVEKNLHKNIFQAQVAALCGMNPSQFSRHFKQIYGMTFQSFLIRRRMSEAVRLLKNPSASVSDVCFTVGFQDLSYFTRTFRRYVGMTPSRYKTDLETLQKSFSLPVYKRNEQGVPSNSN